MSKINDTKKIRELTEDRPLADSELDAVSGGFFADYVKLANSESFGTFPDARKGGAIIVYDYEGHRAKVTVPDIKLG